MSVDNSSPDVDVEATAPDAAATDAEDVDQTVSDAETSEGEEEADQVERAAQGLITIGLFLAFVTFVIFCLPMYFF